MINANKLKLAIDYFVTRPKMLEKSSGKFIAGIHGSSIFLGETKEFVYKAKEEARKILHGSQIAELQEIIVEQEEKLAKYIGSETTSESTIKKFESSKPLTPKQIEELAGVDLNSYVARVWDKMLPNGVWTYSIDVRYRVKDFYNEKQIKDKLKSFMDESNTPSFIPKVESFSEKALIVCISDDHVGAVNVTNMFNNKQLSYQERLDLVLEEILSLNEKFEELHILSLGDQMNGWDSKTTRGGHEVKSLSNEEQFDIYVQGRMNFYSKLFMSGVAQTYFVKDVENSNHSGKGMSYIANRAIELWMDARFPQVYRTSIRDMIDGFEYGPHVIVMGHGKDEKFQVRPMPAILNHQTDLYIYDWLQNKGISPYLNNISFYKGDLHQHGLQNGKFGRYINVPALSGNSDYGDANFGNTRGGALMEVLDKNSYRIKSQVIWF